VAKLRGTFLDRQHYDRVVRDTTRVLKPDGSTLLIYAKDVLARPVCQHAFDTFKHVRIPFTDARGLAAGGQSFRRQLPDGTLSNTQRWRRMRSAVVGYLDRTPRHRSCRVTTFTWEHLKTFEDAIPFVTAVDRVFYHLAPDRWQAQHDFVSTVPSDFVIPGTVFTSVTVNRSERTATHTDQHDYRPGLGVMSVLEGGRYYGCELIFPKYRIAVDMRTGGVCLADVHEWHGNGNLIGEPGFVRLAFVFYAREHMDRCGTQDEELRRLQSR
jgi:hypothetical protein